MAATTMTQAIPEASPRPAPVLHGALRPGVVLPAGADEPPAADDRALALLGCPDLAELARRWPAIRQHLLAEGMSPSILGGAEGVAGPPAAVEPPEDVELPPSLTGGRRILVSAVSMARAIGASGASGAVGGGDGAVAREAAAPRSALLVQDAEVAAALETDLRAASQMRSLAQITPAVAHDLRAPINAMVLNLEVLKETLAAGPGSILQAAAPPAALPLGAPPRPASAARDPRERQQRYVSVLREELTRLHQSLELFLAHVSPRGDRMEALDLRGPAQDLAALLRPPARKQQAQIELLLPDAPVPVLVQPHQLRQALLHLGLAALERVPRDGTLVIRLERRTEPPARARLEIAAGALRLTPPAPTAAAAITLETPETPPPPPDQEPRFSAAGTEARQRVAHAIVASYGGTSRRLPGRSAGLAGEDEAPAFEIEFPMSQAS